MARLFLKDPGVCRLHGLVLPVNLLNNRSSVAVNSLGEKVFPCVMSYSSPDPGFLAIVFVYALSCP